MYVFRDKLSLKEYTPEHYRACAKMTSALKKAILQDLGF